VAPDPLALIAEPRRRRILELVWTAERSAGDIHRAVGEISFGAVSQHLRRLHDAGLVTVRADGRHRYYQADRARLGPLADALDVMWGAHLDALMQLAEQEEQP
jgi:DNA-binding transcriptional ArsR family regulator